MTLSYYLSQQTFSVNDQLVNVLEFTVQKLPLLHSLYIYSYLISLFHFTVSNNSSKMKKKKTVLTLKNQNKQRKKSTCWFGPWAMDCSRLRYKVWIL